MKRQDLLKHLFGSSKKDRIGIAVIVIGIIIVAIVPFAFKYKSATKSELSHPDSSWLIAANDLQQKSARNNKFVDNDNSSDIVTLQYDKTENTYADKPSGTLFYFDPNTLNAAGFKKLGLRDKTIQILLNYRNKGGKFKKPDDLQKIYGLKPEEFQRLRPYINIPATTNKSVTYSQTNYPERNISTLEQPIKRSKNIEINNADTAAFKSLYGIGSKLATKIVNFRDKLGGFYTIEQVGETYGVPPETYQQIKPFLQVNANDVKKINVNTTNYEQLNNHPYINAKSAYQILKYRKEKGNINNINEIKNLIEQSGDDYEKVSKYITTE